MAKDLMVTGFPDRPGVSAAIAGALGNAKINIEGAFGSGKLGEIHLLVEDDDAAAARRAIEDAGYHVSERDVLVVELEDRPGAWAEVARRMADAGVNIDFNYLATDTRMVIAADDLERARAAAS